MRSPSAILNLIWEFEFWLETPDPKRGFKPESAFQTYFLGLSFKLTFETVWKNKFQTQTFKRGFKPKFRFEHVWKNKFQTQIFKRGFKHKIRFETGFKPKLTSNYVWKFQTTFGFSKRVWNLKLGSNIFFCFKLGLSFQS